MILPFLAVSASLKPLAIMVHGAGGGGWEYRVWQTEFEAAGYEVIARDLLPANGGLEHTRSSDYVGQIVNWSPRKPAVLIGASMGGALVLKAAETLKPEHIVLVCCVPPAGVGLATAAKPYPPIVRWAHGAYEDTVAAMPDIDEQTRRYAHERWRDESGVVLDEISRGIAASRPDCPTLCVIPEADDTVPTKQQQAIAKWAQAHTIRLEAVSHVGPLLSTRAGEVAREVIAWLKRSR